MQHNMGVVDRSLRTVAAIALITLTLTLWGAGTLIGIVALVFSGIFLATSAVGFCPAYTLFGLSTRGGVHVERRHRFVAQH